MVKAIITQKDKKRLQGLISKLQAEHPELVKKLENAEIISDHDVPRDVITMNTKIRFFIKEENREDLAKLVYHFDVDKEENNVSVFSLFGTFILGMKVGQEATFVEPGEEDFNIKILEILFQPEASGDWYL